MDVEMGIFIWSHYSRMSGGTDKNQGKSQNTQLSSQDLNHVFSGGGGGETCRQDGEFFIIGVLEDDISQTVWC